MKTSLKKLKEMENNFHDELKIHDSHFFIDIDNSFFDLSLV
jgi:hypothetical protein